MSQAETPSVARISTYDRNEAGHEQISHIDEFSVPADLAKRRRKFMREIGKIIDASIAKDGPTSVMISFDSAL